MFSFIKHKKTNLINDSQLSKEEIKFIHKEFTDILNKMYDNNTNIYLMEYPNAPQLNNKFSLMALEQKEKFHYIPFNSNTSKNWLQYMNNGKMVFFVLLINNNHEMSFDYIENTTINNKNISWQDMNTKNYNCDVVFINLPYEKQNYAVTEIHNTIMEYI